MSETNAGDDHFENICRRLSGLSVEDLAIIEVLIDHVHKTPEENVGPAIAYNRRSEGLIELLSVSWLTKHDLVIGQGYIVCDVKLRFDGKEGEGIRMGVGPIDAALRAISSIVRDWHLFQGVIEMSDSYLHQLVPGSESPGYISVEITHLDRKERDEGNHTDTNLAGVIAIIGAINKILQGSLSREQRSLLLEHSS